MDTFIRVFPFGLALWGAFSLCLALWGAHRLARREGKPAENLFGTLVGIVGFFAALVGIVGFFAALADIAGKNL